MFLYSSVGGSHIPHVGCRMFGTPTYYHGCSLLLLHGRTPGIAGTAKGLLQREPVMRALSEAMLVGSTFTRS
jgi:hypothetical protein